MTSENKTDQPCRVSVVIPCYNHARYLGEAIESALAQTYRDLEIIVVDDGSTDDTPQVAARFGARVRYVHQDNQGLAGARNTGIRAARGEFIALLDADDAWFPDYLARMLAPFEHAPTLGATYCGWRYIDSAGQLLARANIRTHPPARVYQAIVFMNFLVPSGVLVRRACFDHLGLFDENFRVAQGCEDWDMWIRILGNYQMIGVARALVKYRVHGDNMSSKIEQMERAKHAVITKHFGADETKSVLHRRAFGGLYLSSALVYLERGDVIAGQQFFRRALLTFPELSVCLDTFSQLAVTNQPVGARGVFENLDLEASARRLLETLDAIFARAAMPAELASRRADAYGTAFFALGLLAYGKRDLGRARNYLIRAALRRPALILNRQWMLTWLKALLGKQLLGALLHWKSKAA